MKRIHSLSTLVFALVIGLVVLPGCGGDEAEKAGKDGDKSSDTGDKKSGTSGVTIDHSSPEKVFDSMMKSVAAGDNAGTMACFTPENQQEVAAGMIAAAATAGFNPTADKAGMLAVLKEHGIEESQLPKLGPNMQKETQALAKGIKDKPAFNAAMMSKTGVSDQMSAMYTAKGTESVKLKDLETNGDKASAQVTAASKTSDKEEKVHFSRVDGKWYIESKGKN